MSILKYNFGGGPRQRVARGWSTNCGPQGHCASTPGTVNLFSMDRTTLTRTEVTPTGSAGSR